MRPSPSSLAQMADSAVQHTVQSFVYALPVVVGCQDVTLILFLTADSDACAHGPAQPPAVSQGRSQEQPWILLLMRHRGPLQSWAHLPPVSRHLCWVLSARSAWPLHPCPAPPPAAPNSALQMMQRARQPGNRPVVHHGKGGGG